MLIKGKMTLDYLTRKKVITDKLYRFLKSYSVSTFDEAVSLSEWAVFPPILLKELNKIRCNIEENILVLRDGKIIDLYYKGIISQRLYNCLVASDFLQISHVFYYIIKNGGKSSVLLEKRNFGNKCLAEIDEIISFWEYYNGSINKLVKELEPSISSQKDKKSVMLSTRIVDLHKNGMISVRLFHCLYYMELHTISDVLEYIDSIGSIDKLLYLRNFGRKTLTELQDLLSKLELPQKTIALDVVENEITPMENFFIQYNELIEKDVYKDSIMCYYKSCKAQLSARLVHILDANFKSLTDILCLHFTGVKISDLRNCGKKTYEELNIFIRDLYSYVSSLFSQDCESAEMSLLRTSYPFLSENEIEFVFGFQKREFRLPMFYILYNYLVKSESRFERIFCRYYGLKGKSETLKDISLSLNLSFERCRQLLSQKNIQETSLISIKNWEYYDFLNHVLFYNNFDYKRVLDEEGLGYLSKLTFIGLCSLIKDIRICKFGRSDSTSYKEYYISRVLDDSFDLKNSIKDIESTLNKRCTEDVKLPISVFIDSYWLKEPSFDKSKVEDIIIHILKEGYDVELGEDRVLYIQQNAIDRSGEIYKIIEEFGKPMHVKMIRETLISRYPELSDMTIEHVRTEALKHPHIEPLGKSSTYALDKWELYIGTIRDLLYDLLSAEKGPMHIEELYNEVSLIYPNTSIKSITSSMVSDNLQRFVRFVGSYYGVTGKSYDEEYVLWDAEAFSRKNFDERIVEFEVFLKSHHHLPRHSEDNDEEAALCRWYKRVKASDASISAEQQKRLSDLLERYSDYLVTATEYSFYRYCEEFKAFVEDNMEFPTLETDSAKYGWFSKHKKNYMDYEDRRKIYFEELIDFLYTYGFEV